LLWAPPAHPEEGKGSFCRLRRIPDFLKGSALRLHSSLEQPLKMPSSCRVYFLFSPFRSSVSSGEKKKERAGGKSGRVFFFLVTMWKRIWFFIFF